MPRYLIALFMLAVLSTVLSACDIANKHQIDLEDTHRFGFSKSEIVDLGRLIAIGYSLFGDDEANANPRFPSVSSFPRDADLLKQFTPIANLQGRDAEGTEVKQFYGHIWRFNKNSKTLVISIRGTSSAQEWIDDIKFELVPFSSNAAHGQVELGFHQIFSSFTLATPDSATVISLDDYLKSLEDINQLIVIGHSLGSSLATLTAYRATQSVASVTVKSLTFASPLTGDSTFVDAYHANITDGIRIVNHPDIVPRLPLPAMGYQHVWHAVEISSSERPEVVNSIVCHHSLNTYLYLLDDTIKLEQNCRSGN